MKKFIAGLLSLVMLLSLFSCNAENLNDDENINDESTNDINSNTDPDQQPQIDTVTKAFGSTLRTCATSLWYSFLESIVTISSLSSFV